MGVWLMALSGAQPAGNLSAGWVADTFGVSAALLTSALGVAAVGAEMGPPACG